MEPIAEIRLPAHHPAVSKLKDGQHVTIKAKLVKDPEPLSPMEGGMRDKGPNVQPLEHRFHVTDIEAGEDPAEEAGETAAQEAAENRAEKPAPKKKAKTPAELVKMRRQMGK